MKTKFLKNIQIVQTRCATFVETWHAASLLAALLLCPIVLSAQNNGVTVSNLVVSPGSPGTVTFDVSWKNTDMPAMWSDTVWVFVDYNDDGTMKRLPLLPGATLTATSAPGVGKVIEETDNNKGVWVVGNAKDPSNSSGAFSATVQLLTATADLAGACVYASNYPPVGKWKEDGSGVSFTGTPNYMIWLENIQSGAASSVTSGKDFIVSPGYVITSFIDKTGAPGTFLCIPPAAPTVAKGEFCYEQSGELVASASGSVTIEWYDALAGGTLLYIGEIFSLPPLYNASAQYYAQAVTERNCRSVRVKADYTVSNCMISGDCPNYTAGNIDTPTTPVTCTAHYAGQIGSASISPSCLAHDVGRIGN
ncbi:MAG: hypothetical protein LBT61_02050 [Prevotellaceae bacterium]|jgi:hypothetical protein|nr:hypothetical protein [Prevotellaceae bacterium]